MRLRAWIGLGIWGALLGLLAYAGWHWAGSACWVHLAGYYAGPTSHLHVQLPAECRLSAGDPVFSANEDGSFQQIGIVDHAGPEATAVLFASAAVPGTSAPISYVSTPDSLEWAVRTLLPPSKQAEIEAELAAALQENREAIFAALQPIVNRGVREAGAVIEQDLPGVLDRYRPALEALLGKSKEEILKRELLPLVKSEVWPIVRRDSEPLFRQITSELWTRVSLWSFAWRGAADKFPIMGGHNRVENELMRFLDQEAMPILGRHEDDFLVLLEVIFRDLADNERIRGSLRQSIARAAEDEHLQHLLNDIFREVVTENPHVWEVVKRNMSSEEARDALRVIGGKLEPAVRRIGDLLLGTRETGLTPEFARVLRQQILLKDRQCLLLGALPASVADLPRRPLPAWFSGPSP